MAEAADLQEPMVITNFPPSMLTQQSGSEQTAEVFMKKGKDQRKPVKTFKDSDMHSGIVKLKCYLEIDNEKNCFWGTGQICNMTLDNGKVSRCYIQTAAHNFF